MTSLYIGLVWDWTKERLSFFLWQLSIFRWESMRGVEILDVSQHKHISADVEIAWLETNLLLRLGSLLWPGMAVGKKIPLIYFVGSRRYR